MREAIERRFGLEEQGQVQQAEAGPANQNALATWIEESEEQGRAHQAEAVRQNDEILADAGLANQDDLNTPATATRTEEERSADEIPVTTPDGKKIRLIR